VRASRAAALVFLAACAGRSGPARFSPARERAALRATADSLVGDARFANAHWGVLIVDPASADTLYAHNAGKLFMPASNQKLLTGATALAELGPDFRFTTRFAASAPVADGTVRGDLIVVGNGDPSFSDAMMGDWHRAFTAMADSLAAHGVRTITGALRRGGDAFTDSQYGYGWEFDDADEPYGAGVDALYVNEGFTLARRPGPKGDSVMTQVAIRDHAAFFLDALAAALAARGITSGGTDARASVPDSGLATIFSLTSPPLRDVLPVMEKPSQNQVAEILFKTLGRVKAGAGTADSGRRVVERRLLAWGADSTEFAVRDGSGLSRHDYVAPRTIVRVLDAMRRHEQFPVFYASLAIAGVDGTIRNRMKGTAAEGNVHAKTGTVDRARSLSRYVTTADGRLLLFSLLCNNFTVPNRDVERVQDAIVARLAAMHLGTGRAP
jgi:D-alanyl-D-alanine carboxypeptidase/D-alanyl-D-alanine-endopeptidase (penicillin-binding protein 4)